MQSKIQLLESIGRQISAEYGLQEIVRLYEQKFKANTEIPSASLPQNFYVYGKKSKKPHVWQEEQKTPFILKEEQKTPCIWKDEQKTPCI
jgi:hypothetical protein